jgi:hypothetical protein
MQCPDSAYVAMLMQLFFWTDSVATVVVICLRQFRVAALRLISALVGGLKLLCSAVVEFTTWTLGRIIF